MAMLDLLQLKGHLHGALNVGATKEQIETAKAIGVKIANLDKAGV